MPGQTLGGPKDHKGIIVEVRHTSAVRVDGRKKIQIETLSKNFENRGKLKITRSMFWLYVPLFFSGLNGENLF